MNKSYRVIFNHERNAWVAVAEITPAKGKSSCKTTVSSVAGKVALTAAVATAMGTGLISEQAAADKWNITSGSNFTNTSNNLSGTYNDKFFRPGKTSTLKGSAGFFDAKGATEAKQIVMGNHSNNPSWYNDANINIGGENDATNLQNMKNALKIIRTTNDFRTNPQYEENLPAFKVSDKLMAVSQIRTDWTANVKWDHAPGSGVASVAENLGNGYSVDNISAGWYSEKDNCEGKNRHNCTWRATAPMTGHYLNLVGNSTATGASYATGKSGHITGATYGNDNSAVDLDLYEAMLDTYINTGWYFYNENQTVDVSADLGANTKVAAGYAIKGLNATGNTLNIHQGAKLGNAYGGVAEKGNTKNNTVNVNGGTVGNVYGGHIVEGSGSHSNHTINIKGGTVNTVILGAGGSAVNNSVVNYFGGTVNGAIKVTENVSNKSNNKLNLGTNNQRIAMNTLKAGSVGEFNEYNFYLPSNVENGDTALTLTAASNLGNAAVNAYIPGDADLKKDDTVHLIGTTKGVSWNGKGSVYQGVTLKNDLGNIAIQDKNLDLTMLLNNDGSPITPPTPVVNPKVWNVSPNTYTTDVNETPASFNGNFNAAKNTSGAIVNVLQNNDYKGIDVYGAKDNGITNIAGAKNLGGIIDESNTSILNIDASKGSTQANSVNGWKEINFSNLSKDHTALALTQKADLGNKIKLSGSLNDYNQKGLTFTLVESNDQVNVSDKLFAQNKITGNEFNIQSSKQYTVDEFGFHQDANKKSLYINTENTTKAIQDKQFNGADGIKNAIININTTGDFNGLNINAADKDSTINYVWGRNLGVIDGKNGTLNIGTNNKATAMNQRSAVDIKNIGDLNFYLPENIKNEDTALSLSATDKTDLSKTAVTAYLSGDSQINDKDVVHLIKKTNGGEISINDSNNKVTVKQGITLTSTQEMKLSDNKQNLDLIFAKASQDNEQPQSGDDKPQGGNEQPQGGNEQPQGGNEQPQGGNEQPQGGNEQPQGGDDKPQGGNDQPQGGNEQPQGGNDQPQGGNDQPQGGNEQPQGGNEQPQGGNEQPQGGDDKPQGGNKPTVNEKTKSILETPLAAMALINRSSEDLSGSLDDMYAIVGINPDVNNGAAFAFGGGVKERIDSGSHIDLKGGNVKIGYAHNVKSDSGKTLAGVFAEYGRGSYDSYLDDDTHGEGTTQHLGAGVFMNHTFNNDLYLQGSVKAGKVKSDYSSKDFGQHAYGDTVSYDTDSEYVGAHIGVGKVAHLSEDDSIDVYGKYFYTQTASEDIKLSSGETYNLDKVKSHRLRVGAKYKHEFDDSLGMFVGAAFEHEFDGTVNGTYRGYDLPSPSMKGNTGILEVGLTANKGDMKLDASIQGYTGKRRGAGLNFKLRF